ncbi:hypothetical protein [Anatilimnocola floriformis]|uniref:hypothetical protein n=1 Tax=Anatilimnocola floriformis TaxID=2948575 RepID=UPI0020C2D3FE|nr:hypothetical protein [Anatilimnocola floriformis]
MKRESRAPLVVAIVLTLLPVLYVGSYFALVVPEGTIETRWYRDVSGSSYIADDDFDLFPSNYRAIHRLAPVAYWPLEQIDRKVRPGAWEVDIDQFRMPHSGPAEIYTPPN